MEVGGLFGSLLAGRLSDFLVDKYPNDGAVGKRVQVGGHALCRAMRSGTDSVPRRLLFRINVSCRQTGAWKQ